MTRKEAIAYFKEHNEILVSTAKDENVYDYEKQVIEADYMRRCFEANKKAIKALEQTKWIPVSEKLPEEIGTYMTTVDYGMYGLAAGQRYYHGKGLGWEDDCVIAWMPLPEPYNIPEQTFGCAED